MLNTHFKKILITGCQGFTGKILKKLLIGNSYQVLGLESQIDITDYSQIQCAIAKIKPDFVIHLAGISQVHGQKSEDFYKVNLFGTLNLLQALDEAQLNLQKIIIASSAYIYGNCNQELIEENVCPKPINHYGNSKLAMEHSVAPWFDRFPIIIVRPFNYTGIGQGAQFLLPKIVEHFRDKKPYIELGNIDVIRDISAVDFVAQVYWRLLESNVQSEFLNICSGSGHTILDILDMMRELSGHNIEVKFNPNFSRKNEIYRLVGSNKKLFTVIDRIPIVKINEILTAMYRYYP